MYVCFNMLGCIIFYYLWFFEYIIFSKCGSFFIGGDIIKEWGVILLEFN